jgi:hypothetical protein
MCNLLNLTFRRVIHNVYSDTKLQKALRKIYISNSSVHKELFLNMLDFNSSVFQLSDNVGHHLDSRISKCLLPSDSRSALNCSIQNG